MPRLLQVGFLVFDRQSVYVPKPGQAQSPINGFSRRIWSVRATAMQLVMNLVKLAVVIAAVGGLFIAINDRLPKIIHIGRLDGPEQAVHAGDSVGAGALMRSRSSSLVHRPAGDRAARFHLAEVDQRDARSADDANRTVQAKR